MPYADNSKILYFKTSWQKMVEKYLEQLVGVLHYEMARLTN